MSRWTWNCSPPTTKVTSLRLPTRSSLASLSATSVQWLILHTIGRAGGGGGEGGVFNGEELSTSPWQQTEW